MAVRNMNVMEDMQLSSQVFLPITPDDPVDVARMPYKILMPWQLKHYDWLNAHMKFDQDWFSWVAPGNVDMEIYYFAQESDAVRFWLTWQ